MRFLGPEPDAKGPGHKPFRHQFVLLAVEAYRREAISRTKLRELCELAQVLPGEFKSLVATVEQEPDKGQSGRGAHVPRA